MRTFPRKQNFSKGNRKCNRLGKSLMIQAIKNSLQMNGAPEERKGILDVKKNVEKKNCSEPRGRF